MLRNDHKVKLRIKDDVENIPDISIMILGTPGCGKSSLVSKLIDDTFSGDYVTDDIPPRNAVIEAYQRQIPLIINQTYTHQTYQAQGNDLDYPLEEWIPIYELVIVAFDLSNELSITTAINSVSDFIENAKNGRGDFKKLLLVGNKVDIDLAPPDSKLGQTQAWLKDILQKMREEVGAAPYNMHVNYIETSAKTGENVNLLFETAATMVLANRGMLISNREEVIKEKEKDADVVYARKRKTANTALFKSAEGKDKDKGKEKDKSHGKADVSYQRRRDPKG